MNNYFLLVRISFMKKYFFCQKYIEDMNQICSAVSRFALFWRTLYLYVMNKERSQLIISFASELKISIVWRTK